MANKNLKCCIHIPIYDNYLYLIINKNIRKAANTKEMIDLFGQFEQECGAVCRSSNGFFALFFRPGNMTIDIIAHEVFHLTHRILEYSHTNFDSTHHEHAAYLHGYLMELVCKKLKRYIKI